MTTSRPTTPDDNSSENGSVCLTPPRTPSSRGQGKPYQASVEDCPDLEANQSFKTSRRGSGWSQSSASFRVPTGSENGTRSNEQGSVWEDIDDENGAEDVDRFVIDARYRMLGYFRMWRTLSQAFEDGELPYINEAIDEARQKRVAAWRQALAAFEPVAQQLIANKDQQPSLDEQLAFLQHQTQNVQANEEEARAWSTSFTRGEAEVDQYIEACIQEFKLIHWKPCVVTDIGVMWLAAKQTDGSPQKDALLSLLSDKRDEEWNLNLLQ